MIRMDTRPTVTYSGDRAVFTAIEPGLVGGLPAESVEWKRYEICSGCHLNCRSMLTLLSANLLLFLSVNMLF